MKTNVTIKEIENALGVQFLIQQAINIHEAVDDYKNERNLTRRDKLHKAVTRWNEIIHKNLDIYGDDKSTGAFMYYYNNAWQLIVKVQIAGITKSFSIKYNKLEDNNGAIKLVTQNNTGQMSLFLNQDDTIGFPVTDINLLPGYIEENDLTVHSYIVCTNGANRNLGVIELTGYYDAYINSMPAQTVTQPSQAQPTTKRVYKKTDLNDTEK